MSAIHELSIPINPVHGLYTPSRNPLFQIFSALLSLIRVSTLDSTPIVCTPLRLVNEPSVSACVSLKVIETVI